MAPLPLLFLHFPAMSLLLLLLIPPFAVALTPGNITRGSSLTPLGNATSWVSPSGDFAVGFRRLETNGSLFLLAVWFTKPPNQTVVWAANRNQAVQAGSRLELRADGSLVLTDHAGAEVWSPSTGGDDVSHALILDSGNFVLKSAGSPDYAWESFSEPMDTILPSQVLPHGRQLTSRLMESDYSDGRFLLRVQEDGNLVFYTYDGPSCRKGVRRCVPNNPYWASDTMGDGKQLVFSSDGDVSFTRNGSSVILTSAKSIYSPKEFYQRATLDPDGVLRHYVYPRNGTDGVWKVAAFLPSDICVSLRSSVGSGVCGYNSYCIPDGTTPTMNCECPPQYSFVDPARKYKGCKPDFAPQSCDADEGGGVPVGEFRIERKRGTDWPNNDYGHLQPVSEEQCSSECLSDCFCAVAIHRRDECWKKRLPLSNGRYDTSDVGTALLKVAKYPKNRTISPPPTPNPPCIKGGRKGERTWLIVLLGGGNCLLLAAIFLLTLCFHHKKMRSMGPPPEASKLGTDLRSFTYKELLEATQGFKEELGKGAFGTVYKGLIESDSTSTSIAVKRLQVLDDASEKEFENEVRIIARTHHKNLVRLLGYCNEGPHRLLAYEYMSNGSLFNFLQGSTRLHWDTRVQLAFGIARGVLYLHEDCSTQIIHCDIKPQNILIDDNFTPRISDFGMSKLLRTDQSRTLTDIRGTRGYVAPEWFKRLAITSKVDVYSFGVVLLEIICCRRNVDAEAGESKEVLAYWAYDCFREGRLDALVEDEAEPLADKRRLDRLVKVALWCIQEEPSLRPTMKKVTQMLEGAVEVVVPPDPSSYLSSVN